MHFRDCQLQAAIDAGGRPARETKKEAAAAEMVRHFDVVSGYRMPRDRYYHRGHCWVSLERGGRVKVGIDDFMARTFGEARSFVLPEKGASLGQDRHGFGFKRNGHAAAVLSPVTGKIFQVNPKARQAPRVIYQDPYDEGWLFIMEPIILKKEIEALYDESKSTQWMADETQKLLALLGPEYEKLAATGASPQPDLYGHFPDIGWDNLVKTFLHTLPQS